MKSSNISYRKKVFLGILAVIFILLRCNNIDPKSEIEPPVSVDVVTTFEEVKRDTALANEKKSNDPYFGMDCDYILSLYAKEVNDYISSERRNKIKFDKTSTTFIACDLQMKIDSIDRWMNNNLVNDNGADIRD